MAQQTKARAKPKARKKTQTRQKPKTQTQSHGSNGATSKVTQPAKQAGHAVGGAVSKAKVPLLAGGAALAGAAGGAVLGARQARRNGIAAKAFSRRPQVKVTSGDLAKAAKEVGGFGAQVGRLASELQQTREAAGNGAHRSPVEVVLDGLTARRSRG
ncbi:MAG TPA: hypothetical protein VFK14_12165 [Solirubrobacterales bacterium]|nr:hypothetical protein [Solirubrobacterales bacterium]